MDMLDPTLLMLSLVPSGVGFVLFVYGKKEHRFPQLFCGMVFMVYPYFTSTVTSMVGVGAALSAVLYVMLELGW
jgi:hypothetical protein